MRKPTLKYAMSSHSLPPQTHLHWMTKQAYVPFTFFHCPSSVSFLTRRTNVPGPPLTPSLERCIHVQQAKNTIIRVSKCLKTWANKIQHMKTKLYLFLNMGIFWWIATVSAFWCFAIVYFLNSSSHLVSTDLFPIQTWQWMRWESLSAPSRRPPTRR